MNSTGVEIFLFLGFLTVLLGAYDIYRGRNLSEGELVGGLGTYWDSSAFLIRGVMALIFGAAFFVLALVFAFYF